MVLVGYDQEQHHFLKDFSNYGRLHILTNLIPLTWGYSPLEMGYLDIGPLNSGYWDIGPLNLGYWDIGPFKPGYLGYQDPL